MSLGCKDKEIVSSNFTLVDPNVLPEVTYSYPANNTIGPYKDLYTLGYDWIAYSYPGKPHFILQFNKIMNLSSLDTNYIKIEGKGISRPKRYRVVDKSNGVYQFHVISPGDVGFDYSYRLGEKYTITVKKGLTDIHRNELQEDKVITFTPEPYFRVVGFYPHLEQSQSHYFEFNADVDTSILSSMSVTPLIKGIWRLYYPNVVTFSPTESYIPNTKYVFTVASTAKSKAGDKLISDYSFEYFSQNFSVSFTPPYVGILTPLNVPLRFKFSLPIDTSSALSSFSIEPSVPGKLKFSSYDATFFEFVPSVPLQESKNYTATLKSALETKGKTAILGKEYAFNFKTPAFCVSSIFPEGQEVSRHTAIEVRMNTFIDTASIKNAFAIQPSVQGTFEFSFPSRSFIFKPAGLLEPNTDYQITIKQSIKSVNGGNTEWDYLHWFTTTE